ncbi:MAG: tRNA dihydrouridine synthase DusB [Lachnoclostridium sp.]|nr:tRNA dihydrouridine synthase DusB [Lachnoclostridium sp.]
MNGFRIGEVSWEGKLLLAPMAGVTDLPFRLLCKEQGADILTTEMISAKGIYYNSKKTKDLYAIENKEHPIAIQLFGSDPDIMREVTKQIEECDFDIVDLNMGCPVPKIVKNGEGCALMQDVSLAARVAEAVVESTKKPVTVKFRKGFNKEEETAVEFARAMENVGVAAVTVHGRTREQYYSGKADLHTIKHVKDAVRIPVVGNGDIFSPEDAKNMMEKTGCDGIMVARGARGNPWIFRRIKEYLSSGEETPPIGYREVVEMILKHAKMQIEYKGELAGIREMRSHIAWYTKGFPHSAVLREKINHAESYEEMEQTILDSEFSHCYNYLQVDWEGKR